MPSLVDSLNRSAHRTPDRVAVQFGSTSLTYAELRDRVTQLAHELADRGLCRGAGCCSSAGTATSS